jgi:hypothetical protein
MSRVDPLFSYLAVLSVVQPARIQDIEASAANFLGKDAADWLLNEGLLRESNQNARSNGLVVAVRRGVYFLTPKGRQLVRQKGLERSIDNRRFFLMKEQRRRYK